MQLHAKYLEKKGEKIKRKNKEKQKWVETRLVVALVRHHPRSVQRQVRARSHHVHPTKSATQQSVSQSSPYYRNGSKGGYMHRSIHTYTTGTELRSWGGGWGLVDIVGGRKWVHTRALMAHREGTAAGGGGTHLLHAARLTKPAIRPSTMRNPSRNEEGQSWCWLLDREI